VTALTGVLHDPSGAGVAGAAVTAQLVASNAFLADHSAQVIRTATTETDALGAWTLTLTPTGSLDADAASYLVQVDGRRYYVAIPASGTVTLWNALVEQPAAGPGRRRPDRHLP
jgi:hypothetical protein